MATWKRKIYLSSVGVVIVLAALALWYVYYHQKSSQGAGGGNLASILMETNPDFADATQQLKAGNATDTLASLQQALTATDVSSSSQQIILYVRSIATAKNGDEAGAITQLKQIATNQNNSNTLRAYAIQQMGLIYNETLDASVTMDIFSDQPFAALVAPGDTALTYRHLFEYSSSLYPLALSQFYIADWYADQLAAMGAATSTSPLYSNYMGIINSSIASADNNIANTQSQPALNALVPIALGRKAGLLQTLAQIGTTTSDADVEMAYQQALQSFASILPGNVNDASTRFSYAVFLARTYGVARSSDIERLLGPIYTNPAYLQSYFVQLIGDPTNSLYSKSEVVAVSNIDPSFKQFLTSLGWTSADFQ